MNVRCQQLLNYAKSQGLEVINGSEHITICHQGLSVAIIPLHIEDEMEDALETMFGKDFPNSP